MFSKSIILRDFNIHKDILKMPIEKGLDITFRQSENNESYAILQGNRFQINKYCQDAGRKLLSERSRHFNNLVKYKVINTTKVRVQ